MIERRSDIEAGLAALVAADARLAAVAARAGPVPLRRRAANFESLAGIIVSQQVSTASAGAIMARLKRRVDPLTAAGMVAASDEDCRLAGLSRSKERALRAAAEEVAAGRLDLAGLCRQDAEAAIEALVAVRGIGPWTAEIYLLFCAGHPDIFPAGDLALRHAVTHALALPEPPDAAALRAIAAGWAPWRAVAARLFWAYYAALRGREGAPVAAA